MQIKITDFYYPLAKEWMWDYCTPLGKFIDCQGVKWDLGILIKSEGDWSAACVYGDTDGHYNSGSSYGILSQPKRMDFIDEMINRAVKEGLIKDERVKTKEEAEIWLDNFSSTIEFCENIDQPISVSGFLKPFKKMLADKKYIFLDTILFSMVFKYYKMEYLEAFREMLLPHKSELRMFNLLELNLIVRTPPK